MSQDDVQERPDTSPTDATRAETDVPTGTPVSEAPAGSATPADPGTPAKEPDPGDTVGTGTSIALGCIAGTLLLIVIGLIYVAILAIF